MKIALLKDGQYYKSDVVDGHVVENNSNTNKFAEFYDIWTRMDYGIKLTEEMLKSFEIPNLGYIKTNEGIRVFDVTKEEYDEEELPIYVDVFGSITKTKKWINFKTPTKESIEASREIYYEVEKRLKKMKRDADIHYINKLLEVGNGIAYINVGISGIHGFDSILYDERIKVLYSRNGKYIIGREAAKPEIDLYVPDYLIPMIIGKGGATIKRIAAEVKARRINVKATSK